MKIEAGWVRFPRPASNDDLRVYRRHTAAIIDAGFVPRHCRRIRPGSRIRYGITSDMPGYVGRVYKAYVGEYVHVSDLVAPRDWERARIAEVIFAPDPTRDCRVPFAMPTAGERSAAE